MLSFNPPAVYQTTKCYVTHGVMGHLDPAQPPMKSKPWISLASQDFIRRVDLVVPQNVFSDVVWDKLVKDRPAPDFKRVIMSLHDVLTGDFFSGYIKSGNALMLSEGRRGIDNVFYVQSGQLTMLLDKEHYERAGLVGKPHGAKGKRGLKPRWVVEFDLTSPSMIPGKKGFDRLIYATKNVFSTPVTWLVCNLSSAPSPDPLSPYLPVTYTAEPSVVDNGQINIPNFSPPVDSKEDFKDFSTEIYEWLSLVRLQSPRVQRGDQIDPYLSRYRLPEGSEPNNLCTITWQGFISPAWCRKTLLDIVDTLPPKGWFAFSTTTFSKGLVGDNTECTILRLPNSSGEYLMWEVEAHE